MIVTKTRFLTTPGFRALDESVGDLFIHNARLYLSEQPGQEPSMIVGDPACTEPYAEDQGRTMRVPHAGPGRVYCKRDDHPDGPIVTFLLAEEY